MKTLLWLDDIRDPKDQIWRDWINGKIIFRDKETTLSGSALLITNEMGYDWGQVQGAGYWCYQGKTLSELVSEK